MGKLVTDPQLIAKLNAMQSGKKSKVVTDPALIARLDAGETEFDLGEMVSNIPSSAAQFGKDIIQPLMHPIDTAKGLGNLIEGGIDKGAHAIANKLPDSFLMNFAPGNETGVYRNPNWGKEQQADAVGQFYSDRYGSTDNFKKTAMNDPVGLLSDASAVLTGGGALTSKLPGIAGKAGGMVQKAGMAVEPINAVKNTAKYGIGKVASNSLPSTMYGKAAKFPVNATSSINDVKDNINTALKHNVMPTYEGFGKLEMLIGDKQNQIKTIIEAADLAGVEVPKGVVFSELKELRKSVGGFKMYGAKNLAKIDDVAKALDEHLKKTGKNTISASELQEFKVDLNNEINWKNNTQSADLITNKIEKAFAKAARGKLEQINPDIGKLNKSQGEMLQLKEQLMKSAARIERHNPTGLNTTVNAGMGAMVADIPGAMAAYGISLANAPKPLATAGISLHNIKNAGRGILTDNSLPLTLGSQSALQLGRANREGLLGL